LVQNFLTKGVKEEFEYLGIKFTGAGLTKATQEKILYDNLDKMLGKPNAIDYDYFIEKCEKLMERLDRDTLDGTNLWCMKNDFESMKKGTFKL
jgi:hypothetical protein